MPQSLPSPAVLAGPDGFEVLREAMWNRAVPMRVEVRRPGEFAMRWRTSRWGPLEVACVDSPRATPVECVRTASAISRADPGAYAVLLQRVGRTGIAQLGREDVLAPGELALVDTTRPFSETYGAGRLDRLVALFPRDALGVCPEDVAARLAGRALPTGDGVGPLLVPLLAAMNDHPAQPRPVTEYAAGNALDLLAVFLSGLLDSPAGQEDVAARSLVLRVKAHVRRHLADPDLSPPAVAAAHHVSLRHLQKLFAEQGLTVSGLIRRERLELCRRRLEDAAHTGMSVTEIAHQAGFRDSAHFSRVFKAAYGVSPREHRMLAAFR
ncbi:MAG TPA: helix-turn-helix domain-containing protein [Thermomonospora sp.]|nr:helix-turn-helix domain-containing protein [Thermomonospora sp.]